MLITLLLLWHLQRLHLLLECLTHGVLWNDYDPLNWLMSLLCKHCSSFLPCHCHHLPPLVITIVADLLFFMEYLLDLEQNILSIIDILDIHWNYLSNEYSCTKIRFRMKELCHLYSRDVVLSELFPARVTSNVSAINPCRKFQMKLRFIRWKANLMGLPNIRKYSVFILWSRP